MTKRITTITVLILSIIIVSLYVITSTYSLIIDVIDKDGTTEIVNNITIRDLVTNDDGSYNDTYYQVLDELNINNNEANIIMESVELNKALDIVINNLVDYNFNNKDRLTNDEIYNLIVSATNEDDTINNELKNKIITKSKKYIYDITDYIYGIKTRKQGENV